MPGDAWCHLVTSWDVSEEHQPHKGQGGRSLSAGQWLPWEGGFLSKQRKMTRADARNQQPVKDQGEIAREKRKLFQRKGEG